MGQLSQTSARTRPSARVVHMRTNRYIHIYVYMAYTHVSCASGISTREPSISSHGDLLATSVEDRKGCSVLCHTPTASPTSCDYFATYQLLLLVHLQISSPVPRTQSASSPSWPLSAGLYTRDSCGLPGTLQTQRLFHRRQDTPGAESIIVQIEEAELGLISVGFAVPFLFCAS